MKNPINILVMNGDIYVSRVSGRRPVNSCVSHEGALDGDGRLIDAACFLKIVGDHFARNGIVTKRVNLIVKTPECVLRFIKLPPVAEKDIRGLVAHNLNEYFPMPVDRYAVSYRLLGKSGAGCDIMLAALPEQFAEAYAEAFARLKIVIYKLDDFRNAAAVAFDGWGKSALLVMPQADRINVMPFTDGVPKGVRDIYPSGGAYGEISALQRMYGMSDEVKIFTAAPEWEQAATYFPGSDIKTLDIFSMLGRYV